MARTSARSCGGSGTTPRSIRATRAGRSSISSGEIVGVNEISFGLGGAIPSNLARSVVDALIKDGRVKRSWTGIEVQPRIGDGGATGALVSWVAETVAGGSRRREGRRHADQESTTTAIDAQVRGAAAARQSDAARRCRSASRRRSMVARDGKELDADGRRRSSDRRRSRCPSELTAWGLMAAEPHRSSKRASWRATRRTARASSACARTVRPIRPSRRCGPGDIIVEVEGHAGEDRWPTSKRETKAALGSKDRAKVLVEFERNPERDAHGRRNRHAHGGRPAARGAARRGCRSNVQVLTPPLAERLGLKGKTGVRVTRLLDPATPLHVGDIILAIDGDPVRATAPTDDDLFASAIRRYRVGRVRQAHDQPRRHGDAAAGHARADADAAARDEVVRRSRSSSSARATSPRPIARIRASANAKGVLVESVAVRGWASLGTAERRRSDPGDRRSAGGGRRRRSRPA